MDKDNFMQKSLKRKAQISFGTDIVKNHKLLKYKEMQINNTKVKIKDEICNDNTENKYSCSICYEEFKTETILNIHMWAHAAPSESFEVKSFACLECKKTYSVHNFFLQHLKINHSGLHFCKYCTVSFETLSAMKLHVKESHKIEIIKRGNDDAKFVCVFCQACYFSINHLVSHLCEYHSIDILDDYYPLCKTACENISSGTPIEKENKISEEIMDKEIEKQKSTNAQNKTSQKILIENSKFINISQSCPYKIKKNLVKENSKTIKYNCSHCNIKFLRSHQLQKHKKSCHKIDKFFNPIYGCGKCSAKFFKKRFLQQHLINHHKLSVTPKIIHEK